MMLSWVYGIEQSYIIEEKNIFKKIYLKILYLKYTVMLFQVFGIEQKDRLKKI